MFEKKIKTRIVNKHALEVDWLTSTLVPLKGELIIYDVEVDENGNTLQLPEGRTTPYTVARFKIGDGFTSVTELPFVTNSEGSTSDYVLPEAGVDLGGVKTGGDVTITDGIITVNDDSHMHSISTVSGLQDAVVGTAQRAVADKDGNEITETYATKEDIANAGYGDMLKSVYDTDGDGVVDNAERLGGVDASSYVKTEDLGSLATKSTVDKDDLSEDIQESLNKADTAIQSIDGLATEDYVDNLIESLGDLAAKSTVEKSDLSSDVQTSLDKADTALQSYTETDPTVPEWAKASTKPSYTASEVGAVPTSRTVNGKALSADITLSASDVGAIPDTIPIPDSLADLTSDETHRTVTDAEKATWNAKSNFSGSYNDLTNKPTIPAAANNGTLTIQKNGTTVTTFGANQGTDATANITVPTKVSDLSNDSNFASTTYVDNKVASIVDTAPEALNTLNELAAALGDDPNFATTVMTEIGKKVDKVSGKGLSTNDYTTAEKDKLAGIATGANNYTHPSYTAKSSGLYKVTVDDKGHVSGATAVTKADITALGIPGSDTNTDTKVLQNRSTTANYRPLLMQYNYSSAYGTDPGSATEQVYYHESIAASPYTGSLRATKFVGALEGNASSATTLSCFTTTVDGDTITFS